MGASVVPALAPAASAPAQPTVVAEEARPSKVAAFGGWSAWSRYDESTGNYTLVAREPATGTVTAMPLEPRAVPFDLDLGPDRDGRVVAVYSRCDRDPPAGREDALPEYRLGRGCRLMTLDLLTGRERTLLRRSGRSLVLPAIWRDRLAFVVRGRRRSDVGIEQVTFRRGRSPRRVRVPGGSRAGIGERLTGPEALDVDARRVVYTWRAAPLSCPRSAGGRIDSRSSAVHVFTGGRRRTLDRGCIDEGIRAGAVARVWAPSLSGGSVSWLRARGTTVRLRRRSQAGDTRDLPGPSPQTYSLAVDGQDAVACEGFGPSRILGFAAG